jgi:inhibitor of KinA
MGYDHLLQPKPLPGMYQTVPAYASLTVFFDPMVLAASPLPGKTCFEKAREFLLALNETDAAQPVNKGSSIITIPVCYGGPFGTDLDEVANFTKLDRDEIIKRHSEAVYKVCMIGFIPGFAYLGGLDALLRVPRKPTPVKVSPGDVGIASVQTGVYPLETPGGWQIIGRTPLRLFDATRPQPSLLKTGDHVKFEPISFAESKKYLAK